MENVETILKKYNFSVDKKYINEKSEEYSKSEIQGLSAADIAKKLISFLDLTTLEGKDTRDTVVRLCEKAKFPSPGRNDVPSCAAVCIYPVFIKTVKENLKGSGVRTASVSTGFPSGQVYREVKLLDVEMCLKDGADEIDMVISRGEFLSGNFQYVFDEICMVKNLCKNVNLKVILGTGELATYENIRKASFIAMEAGADFIKTSTGKISPAATLPVTFVMIEAIKEFYELTGKKIGIKPAGGIRNAVDAFGYYSLVYNVLDESWLNSSLFRVGASSLLDNLVKLIV
ncbi:MAG: deoxyribose-phosphate aldolase [Ignavibacteria bacterium]|nr:deoxyribose-phosphate aldolase [Ignavibacteria bacterium]